LESLFRIHRQNYDLVNIIQGKSKKLYVQELGREDIIAGTVNSYTNCLVPWRYFAIVSMLLYCFPISQVFGESFLLTPRRRIELLRVFLRSLR
jgi:hypothetical protein